jgi:RNA polymerase sigma-70 factor (ECF subfamily)
VTVPPGSSKEILEELPIAPSHSLDLRSIYKSEFPFVWRTLLRLGVKQQDAEDLAHDLFLVVHRRLATYDRSRPLRPWLFGIAFRIVHDFKRAPRKAREVLGSPADRVLATDSSTAADEKVAAAEMRSLLLKALDCLDLDHRAVFVMHDIEEVSAPDVAVALEIPVNTVYSRLRHAREKIAAAARRLTASRGRP